MLASHKTPSLIAGHCLSTFSFLPTPVPSTHLLTRFSVHQPLTRLNSSYHHYFYQGHLHSYLLRSLLRVAVYLAYTGSDSAMSFVVNPRFPLIDSSDSYYPEHPGYKMQRPRYSAPPEYGNMGRPTYSRSVSRASVPSVRYPNDLEHSGRNCHPQRAFSKCRHSDIVQPDIIDLLDNTGNMHYHHEGPYDAVKPERNRNPTTSPVEATSGINEEALKATSPEKVIDSVFNGFPIDGTAYRSPGTTDLSGHVFAYEEGPNLYNDHISSYHAKVIITSSFAFALDFWLMYFFRN